VALHAPVNAAEIAQHALTPAFPENSGLLVIGLIGTTVVPYNLFLASGLAKGQDVGEMRWGLGAAVLIGGIISFSILLTGIQVKGGFSFQTLAGALQSNLGDWAGAFFGIGLFAAGASSSVTAPLAAAIAGQSIFGKKDEKWAPKSRNFRIAWAMVLGTGLVFGLSGVKPIPAIIAAQAINGLLLPVVAVFLLIAVNDRNLLPKKYRNSMAWNVAMGLVVLAVAALGLYNLWQVF